MRNVETTVYDTHNFPSKPFILYKITETVPFNNFSYKASIMPREINTTLDKDFLAWISG